MLVHYPLLCLLGRGACPGFYGARFSSLIVKFSRLKYRCCDDGAQYEEYFHDGIGLPDKGSIGQFKLRA